MYKTPGSTFEAIALIAIVKRREILKHLGMLKAKCYGKQFWEVFRLSLPESRKFPNFTWWKPGRLSPRSAEIPIWGFGRLWTSSEKGYRNVFLKIKKMPLRRLGVLVSGFEWGGDRCGLYARCSGQRGPVCVLACLAWCSWPYLLAFGKPSSTR